MTSARTPRECLTANQSRRLAFSGIEQRLLARWRASGPPRGSVIVVAFSGGPDSLALAAMLGRLAPKFDACVQLVHVDHGLRATSADEATHARELAAALGLEIEIAAIPGGVADRHPGVGLEEAVRRERYLILQQFAAQFDTNLLATGHHLDDQVETVLLHLLRGAGLRGASAMQEWTELNVPWWQSRDGESVRIWRPLLTEPRAALLHEIERRNLAPNVDTSNSDLSFQRNVVRHRLLPAIDECAPAGRNTLARFAEIAAEEDRYLDSLVSDAIAQVCNDDGNPLVAAARDLPRVIRLRLLARWLSNALPYGIEPTHERVTALDALLTNHQPGKHLEIGGDYVATVAAGKLVAGGRVDIEDALWASFGGPRVVEEDELPRTIELDRRSAFSQFELAFWTDAESAREGGNSGGIQIRAVDATGPLVVRRLEPGDRFVCRRRVADWLANQGIPSLLRAKIICVAGKEGVIWVPGVDLPPPSRPGAGDAILVGRWKPRT